MRLLMDENVRKDAAAFLRNIGHDVSVAPPGTANGDLLALAVGEGRILLTHDKDFSNTAEYPPESTCGIVCLRVDPALKVAVHDALGRLLQLVPPVRFAKRLFIVDSAGILSWPT